MAHPRESPPIELLLEHRDFVRGLARHLLANEHGAEDLVQGTWMSVLLSRSTGVDRKSAFLAGIVRHLAAKERRRAGRSEARERRAARAERLPSTEEIVAREEWRRKIVEHVLELAPLEREAILLRFFEGLPPRRIARDLGIPVATVKTRIQRGLARLRPRLAGRLERPDLLAGLSLLALGRSEESAFAIATRVGIQVMSQATKWKIAAFTVLAASTLAVVCWIPWGASGGSDVPDGFVLAQPDQPSSRPESATENVPSQREALVPGAPPGDPGAQSEAEIEASSRLLGRVVDEEDRPIAGAEVASWSGAAPGGPAHGITTSDLEGRFALEHLGSSVYVQASASGFLPVQAAAGNIDAGSTIDELVLRLARPISHRIRVLSPEGAPVAGASLELELRQLHGTGAITRGEELFHVRAVAPALVATSGPDGIADFQELAAAEYRVSVRHPAFEPHDGSADPSTSQPITEVVLRSGDRIAGRVFGPDGSAVAGAEVLLRAGEILGRARTDEEGRFAISNARPAFRSWLSVVAPGHAMHVLEPMPADTSERQALDIRLEVAHALAGTVQVQDGTPIADLVVEIEGDRLVEGDASRFLWKMPTWEALLGTAEVRTDAEGRFRFDGLYEGSFRIAVVWEEGVQHRQFFEARSGAEDLVLVLDRDRIDDVTFEGRVSDAITGMPIERFSIVVGGVTPEGVEYNSARVQFDDAEGRYAIGGVRPMNLILFVQAPGYRDAATALEPYVAGRYHEDISLSPVRSLRLRVVDPYGRPVPSTVSVGDAEGNHFWVPSGGGSMAASLETDANGEVMLQNLPATLVRVNAWPAARSTWPKDAQQFWEVAFDLSRPIEGVEQLVIDPPR